jgi:hypothetical protein
MYSRARLCFHSGCGCAAAAAARAQREAALRGAEEEEFTAAACPRERNLLIYYIIRIVFFVFTETQFFYFGFKSALESVEGEYTSKHPLRPLNQNSLNTHISRKCREMACNM